jgi:UDP-N-acetylglucosamine--N-acetylmuramyl-(pentapeptide) pyrophosphoryl-undecaprenol N-acetylglucosamine transferase
MGVLSINRPQSSVMLASGGTGGHMFPAFALAEELARRGIVVDLMTDMRGDRYGSGFPARRVFRVPAATLSGSNPLAAARTVFTLAKGVKAAREILTEVRPGAVIGFGGYPSFPPLVAASLMGLPTALHEQNAVLGRANRLLARRVTLIATSFEGVRRLDEGVAAKARFTGNPVRDAVIQWASIPYRPSGSGEPFRLLVFGGSQGARFFSETLPPALRLLPEPLQRRLKVIQQARPEDEGALRAAYAKAPEIVAAVAPFFDNLPELMTASHLVIARAGASTVAELAVLGRPAILVPLPHALDNDQLANATRLVDVGAAVCLEQAAVTPEGLAAMVAHAMEAPGELAAAAKAARSQGRPDAVQRLANLVAGLMAGAQSGGKTTA